MGLDISYADIYFGTIGRISEKPTQDRLADLDLVLGTSRGPCCPPAPSFALSELG